MRILCLAPVVVAGLFLTGCTRTEERHDDTAARQAGREAYRASEDVKHDAEKAAKELRNAGKEFREGWSEARHEDPPRRDVPKRDDRRRRSDH